MRWFEEQDTARDDAARPSRRWTAGLVAVAGLGAVLVTGIAVAPAAGGQQSAGGPTAVATEQAAEPTGRPGLRHTLATPPPPSPVETPIAVAPVAEVAATGHTVPQAPATTPAAAPAPVVGMGQSCDVPGATGVTAHGDPAVCRGTGRATPRWHRA